MTSKLSWDEGDTDNVTRKLYHYSPINEETVELDPERLGQNEYSRREKQVASTPRTFFYTDPNHKEPFVSGRRFSAEVPASLIYDLTKDRKNLVEKVRLRGGDIDDLLAEVKEHGFKGVTYNQGVDVVAWLDKIQAKRDE